MINPREAQLDFIVTRSAIAAMVLLILVFLCSFTYKDGFKYGVINLSPVVTSGIILNIENVGELNRVALIDYEFVDKESSLKIIGRHKQDKRFDNYPYGTGSSIDIISSKYLPNQNIFKHRLYQLETSFNILFVSFLVGLTILVFLAWNIRQYYHFKNESKRY